jgi:hypothetical protein
MTTGGLQALWNLTTEGVLVKPDYPTNVALTLLDTHIYGTQTTTVTSVLPNSLAVSGSNIGSSGRTIVVA